jgi:formate dehydrogenase iron-sulfur subunit
VISLATVPVIFEKGAQHYADFGLGRSRGTMPVQIAGNVKRGGLFETAFGLPLGELVDDVAGGTASGRPVKAVQVGGPLGAYMPPEAFDTPFAYEEFDGQGGLIGHAGVVVFDDSADMLQMARFAMEFCAVESCGKCTPCRIGAVRGVETIDRIAEGDAAAKDLLVDLCDTMTDGSLCALGGLTPYPVLSAMRNYPEDFARPKEAAE